VVELLGSLCDLHIKQLVGVVFTSSDASVQRLMKTCNCRVCVCSFRCRLSFVLFAGSGMSSRLAVVQYPTVDDDILVEMLKNTAPCQNDSMGIKSAMERLKHIWSAGRWYLFTDDDVELIRKYVGPHFGAINHIIRLMIAEHNTVEGAAQCLDFVCCFVDLSRVSSRRHDSSDGPGGKQ
jgi:hypothetical protein